MYMVLNPTNTNGRILVNKENSYEVALNSAQKRLFLQQRQGLELGRHSKQQHHNGMAYRGICTQQYDVGLYQDGTLTESIVPASNQTGNIQPSNNIFTVGGRGTAAPTGSFFLEILLKF